MSVHDKLDRTIDTLKFIEREIVEISELLKHLHLLLDKLAASTSTPKD